MVRVCSLVVALLLASPALADSAGRLTVIDGDTFDVGGTHVRLFGVDAPEHDQTCIAANGTAWDCGAWVTTQVTTLYGGTIAACIRIDTDRYGREVSRCSVDGADLGQALVIAGLATAYREYSMDYDLAEKSAQATGAGIWSSSFDTPAEFRADQRPAPQAAPGDCLIKGNISDSGRIYHVPGNENYADTRINTARGERWFCNEAEARAAGWRPARN
jgi:endonuclease YncB( thermonuclease family)